MPNADICTVAEDKVRMREDLENWYRGSPGSNAKIDREIEQTFRYARDTDVIIKFC